MIFISKKVKTTKDKLNKIVLINNISIIISPALQFL